MNLVDDAKKKVEDQKQQMEEVGRKEIELAQEQQKLKEEMAQAVDMDTSPDEAKHAGGDVSLG